jgi:O-glycosyl hydrolase
MKKKKIIAALLVLTVTVITTCQLEVDEVIPGVALTDPYISKQPASYSFFVGEMDETPALSIEVKDWRAAEGSLTYQWYTFETIDDYVLGNVDKVGASGTLSPDADGIASASYTPSAADGFSVTAGSKNYYYVEVTNTNSAVNVGANTGDVRSEVAIISFTAAGEALSPIISRHPGSAGYQAGRAVNSVNVRTAARPDRVWTPDPNKPLDDQEPEPPNALLSYQWYILTVENGVITRELIPNVTTASYQPDPTALKFGSNYFYVEITSTEQIEEGGELVTKEATEVSVPAVIRILPGIRAVAPVITVQPRDKMYFTNETTVAPLTVTAETRDNGEISYQWYSTTLAYASGGTAVPGETNSTFTPPLPAVNTAQYYYAIVTNKNEFVTTNQTTATAATKAAKISVAQSGTMAESTGYQAGNYYNAVVTVANPKTPSNPGSNRYQYIRGYGGMDVAWSNFPRTYPQEMETMYNPDTGLGYNINRIMISPGKVDPVEGINDLLNGQRPDYYENVRIVNKYNGYNLASPWSPPKEWKSNNSINGGGILMTQYYKQFANYLRAFAQNMYDNGAPIYAISISNEPNYTAGYDGCEWTADEMKNFYKQVGRFTNGVRGYGGGKQISTVLTVNGESANTPTINIAALTDPVSRAAIDLYCRHVYGVQTTTLWRYGPTGSPLASSLSLTSNTTNILDRGDGTKMEVWMTEHNINSANAQGYVMDSQWNYLWRYLNDVDLVMRLNNENAFVWWASKRFYSMIGDGQYGTPVQNASSNVIDRAVLPRGWGLSHYAKYTIDTHRIVTTISGTLANSTAITNEDNDTNVNSRNFSLDNISPRITAYASITSGKDNAPINESTGLADVEFISLVMWTPSKTDGTGGTDMGTIKIQMPPGFIIGSYTAIKSNGGAANQINQPYAVTIDPDRTAAYVDLRFNDDRGELLSVKFIKE